MPRDVEWADAFSSQQFKYNQGIRRIASLFILYFTFLSSLCPNYLQPADVYREPRLYFVFPDDCCCLGLDICVLLSIWLCLRGQGAQIV